MATSYPLGTPRGNLWTTRLQVRALIDDLSRSIDLLTAEIEEEETRVGVHDVADPTYPVLAQSLRKRRDNIGATIASLEQAMHRVPKAA